MIFLFIDFISILWMNSKVEYEIIRIVLFLCGSHILYEKRSIYVLNVNVCIIKEKP